MLRQINFIRSIMVRGKAFGALLLCLGGLLGSQPLWALGGSSYILESSQDGAFPLVGQSHSARIYVDQQDYPGVIRAAGSLQADIKRVTGKSLPLQHEVEGLGEYAVIVGTLGHSALLDQLVAEQRIDVSAIAEKWDAFHMQVVQNPLPGIKRALVIAGANRRGTSYGVFDLTEQMGVSPWHYWADIPVAEKAQVYVQGDLNLQDAPVVKYRGIFLNNEAPALTNWVHANHEEYNHEFYVKVFDLILRLKGNYLWPVMWNNAFNTDDPKNMKLAHEYGIVMGTSHHEPMMRADKEWDRYGEGKWEYSTNPENLYQFWLEGAQRNKPYESLITLGMRGQEDTPMSEGHNIELLETIIADQREIISKVFDDRPVEEVPQVWCLYKEVQGFYERGMRVPDDVILLWTNDNWGNIRRLPTPEERKRPGGAGMYYHFDYVGGPRSYRGVNSMPLAKMWEQMNLAYHYEANQIWIVNVGILKHHEFPTEFFLRMAWDPEHWSKNRLQEFGILWAEREFGSEYAREIEALMTDYTRHNGRRKVELQAPDTFSLLNYREADRILEELADMVDRADALRNKIPKHKQDAFHQLVWHPVQFAANITRMNIAIGKNRMYAQQGRSVANQYAEQAKSYFAFDRQLRDQYHALNGGKWHHFMDQTHIGYTNWQSPEGNQLPALAEYVPGDYAEMGVGVEGFYSGWPSAVSGSWPHEGSYQLRFDYYGQEQRELVMYNRGTQPYEFTAVANEPWIQLSHSSGEVRTEHPIQVSIDWDAVPEGQSRGQIEIRGTGWQSARFAVYAVKPSEELRNRAAGYLEADGYISVEAANYHRNEARSGFQWREIPAHGRTHSSMSPYPITDISIEDSQQAPYLEYEMTFFSTGVFEVQTFMAPSWPFMPGRGLRYAVAVGDESPQVVDITAEFDGEDSVWERRVKDGVAVTTSLHEVKEVGPTRVRIYMIDPGVALQKLLINTGRLKPSYLGPPQSPQAQAAAESDGSGGRGAVEG